MQPQHLPFIFWFLHCWGEGIVLMTRLTQEVLTSVLTLIPQLNNSGFIEEPQSQEKLQPRFPLLQPDSPGLCFAGAEGKSSTQCLLLSLLSLFLHLWLTLKWGSTFLQCGIHELFILVIIIN